MTHTPQSAAAVAAHRKRALWLGAVLWTALLAAGAAWWIQQRTLEQRVQARLRAELSADGLGDTMAVAVRQLAALPANVARRPITLAALSTADLPPTSGWSDAQRAQLRERLLRERAVLDANAMLAELMRDFGLPLAVLLDRHGTVVADGAARDGVHDAIGLSLRHRNYFIDALASGTASQYLVGRASREPGIYFSARAAQADGRAAGVVVLKQDTATLNRLFAENDGGPLQLVADAHGVIILGDRAPLLGQRLPAPISGAPPEPGWQSVYQSEPATLPWRASTSQVDGLPAQVFSVGDAPHLAASAALPGHPFTAWAFAPLPENATSMATVSTAALTIWLAGLLLLWGFGRRIETLEMALDARRELSDLAQALPLTVFRYEQPDHGRGRFAFVGAGLLPTLGVDAATLQRDPTLPWRMAGDPQERPPAEPVEFPIDRGNRITWVRAHSVPAPSRNGSVVHNGYWLDVTDRREAETRFSAVIEHAPSGYLFFDRQRGITHCNPATLALFGVADEHQLRGRVLWFPGLSPPLQADGQPSRERALDLMRRHFSTRRRVQSFEWRFQRADGQTFDAEVNVIALGGSTLPQAGSAPAQRWDGEPQFCAVLTDISARKATALAMDEARAAAEAASRTKTSFLANMSHELRTPMNAIIGMTHLALEDELAPRQRGYVAKAHGAARNLLQILDDILDVSKVEAGHLDLERIEFRLESVVSEMADMLALKAEEKGLKLLFSAAPGLPERLVGDPTRLRQVMVNLGSNAIKFTDRGEVTLGIDTVARHDDEIELHVWVKDTGVGLTAEQQSRVFHPFVQADNSTTRRFGGTGLGLTISRQLVEKMGGRLWVESAPGRGATFHFTARFGLHASRPAPPEAGARATPTLAAARERLAGSRVLLVEDHPLNQELARDLLERAGMHVTLAGDGAQALRALERDGPFDGVLMDCQMPLMDGYTATERLRSHPAWRDLPVIAMTASALAADRERAFAAGMDAHIAKPLDVEAMFRTLAEWISPARAPAPPMPAEQMPPLPPDLAALRHIDAQDALARCSGNEALLRRLLHGFAQAQAGFEAAFAQARASADRARAEHLAHDLKGLAGNLGARALQGAAAALQEACRHGDEQATTTALAYVVTALRETLQEIAALGDPKSAAGLRPAS